MTNSLLEDLQRALGGAYRLERELGGGGMSRVFVAEETALQRKVVVKILPPELVAGLSVDRFRREIQLAAQLQHPNIVPVLATGEANGLPWFTMPFVSGESLRARLVRETLLPLRDAVAILRDVASALEFAHGQGIVHRDIKPDNVLLAGRAAVVTDFGIAKAISASRTMAPGGTLTQVGTSLGTPAYMAPEQAAGDPNTDARADLYAFGVMAFELLAGRLPFAGTLPHELIKAHMLEVPPRLDSIRADVPASLVAMVATCLEKNPSDRPSLAAEIVRTLESVPLSQERPSSPPLIDVQADAKTGARRRRAWPVALAAAALVAAIGGGAYWWKGAPVMSNAVVADVAVPTPPAYDPAFVLLVPPAAADPSLATIASLAGDALSRALGGMRYAQVTVASNAGTDARAQAKSGRMATIVDGRVYPVGDSLQLDVRLTDAATGAVLRALAPVRLGRDNPTRGLDAALEPLVSAVAIVTNPLFGPSALPVGALPSLGAVRALEQAMIQRDFPQLMAGLDRAVSLDSAWTLPRVIRALRYARYSPYYQREEVRRAYIAALPSPSEQLSPYEAALREAAASSVEASPERLLAALRRVQQIAPGSYGATLYINILQDLNRPREALEQLLRVGPFVRDAEAPAGAPMVEAPIYWANIADLQHYVGGHQAERVAAERFAELAGVSIPTLTRRGVAYAALGDSALVEEVVSAAEVAPSETAPNQMGGEVLLIVAQELMAHGHDTQGRQVLDRALRWLAAHRDERIPGADTTRTDIAFREVLALRVAGRNDEALAKVRPLMARSTSDTRFRAFYGRIQAVMGNRAAVDSVTNWLTEIQQDPARAGSALSERAFIAVVAGQKEEAVALLRESFARGSAFYIRRNLHRFNDWWPLRGYKPYEQLLTPQG